MRYSWRLPALGKRKQIGCPCALIILLDQFALNIHRSGKESFEASKIAIPYTNYVVSQKWDAELPLLARLFVYLPLEHSEALEDQKRSVELFQQAVDVERAAGRDTSIADNLVKYAVEHYTMWWPSMEGFLVATTFTVAPVLLRSLTT